MSKLNNNLEPIVFILDVDGVLTNGQFIYSKEGKLMKIFGPDDNDALSLLAEKLNIRFVTGDKKGFDISKKRIVDDMGFELDLVSTVKRLEWISNLFPLNKVIYMGDGIFDHYVMKNVAYAISPANADQLAKQSSNYVTIRSGGDRAVAEACLHIMEKFFTPYNPDVPPEAKKLSGEWSA
jgi:3-deoxy-D-manno-octulosonate 8-phosphate phosphatase (KDO 8-P phosphatase)